MIFASLLPLLCAAVWSDYRSWIISNRLVLTGLFLGLLYQILKNGTIGILYFLICSSIPVILFFLLFLMHALGAGDIKLLSMTGSFFTVTGIITISIFTLFSAAVIGAVKLAVKKNAKARVRYFFSYVAEALSTGKLAVYDPGGSMDNRIHFSLAVFIGSFIYLGVNYCKKF